MFKEITLPDGTVAESVQDIERYLKQTGSASESDYSADYYKNRRFFTEKAQQDKLHADFIHNLKKELWLND